MTISTETTQGRQSDSVGGDDPKSLRGRQKRHIAWVLEETGHDLASASAILDVSVPRLRRLMRELRIQKCSECKEIEHA